jgi:hypothetical protein
MDDVLIKLIMLDPRFIVLVQQVTGKARLG